MFAVANQKGGVGKTTTVVNLGAYLGALGSRVLLVDCDPQANCSGLLNGDAPAAHLGDVLTGAVEIGEAATQTDIKGVELLSSAPTLAGLEVELMDVAAPGMRLKEVLGPEADQYDYVLLDCPPSLGVLTVNALVAADAVLIPVQCEYLALEGLARLLDTLDRVRDQSNPSLRIFGLVMTMYDGRTLLSQQVAAEVRRHYPTLTFDSMIPRNVRLSEAPSFGQSILQYDPYSRGAEAYQALAMEVAARAPRLAAAHGSS
ncbi:MAG: ParA family protein [Chloroflexota bacterium]